MEGRADGKNTSWKWVQENQPVPFSEFTRFYADLSQYVETKRNGYQDLEKRSQQIAQSNNTLLDTLPNNLYNKVLGLPHIDYKPGFTSKETQEVFSSGIEEIK